jgi:hypothetical protein
LAAQTNTTPTATSVSTGTRIPTMISTTVDTQEIFPPSAPHNPAPQAGLRVKQRSQPPKGDGSSERPRR